MCGLDAYKDAVVGSLGVEMKKRTTIGVELAAKVRAYLFAMVGLFSEQFLSQPKLLLFLDEPTSGLDSQSAWAIVSFLRDLADSGQAILCTFVHLPRDHTQSLTTFPHSIHQVGNHRFWMFICANMGLYSLPLSFSKSLIGCSCCGRVVKLSTLVMLGPALRRSSSISKGTDHVTAVSRKTRTLACVTGISIQDNISMS